MCIASVKDVSYVYSPDSPFSYQALYNISADIRAGEIVGLIGTTGSGKTTLAQMFNALLFPSAGEVIIDSQATNSREISLKLLRQKVGFVFQFPEYQLFEETVYRDIAFGAVQMGLKPEEIEKRVRKAMEEVELPWDQFRNRFPFELSGGEQRRVALAGILVMEPQILVLDEPLAGLDPEGRKRILQLIRRLNKQRGLTVIFISHRLEILVSFADRILVLHRGKLKLFETPEVLLSKYGSDFFSEVGLQPPCLNRLMFELKKRGKPVATNVLTVSDAKNEIMKVFRKK